MQGVLLLILLGVGMGAFCLFFLGASEGRGTSRERNLGVVRAEEREPAPAVELAPVNLLVPQEAVAEQQQPEGTQIEAQVEAAMAGRDAGLWHKDIPEGPKMRHVRLGKAQRVDPNRYLQKQAEKANLLRQQREKDGQTTTGRKRKDGRLLSATGKKKRKGLNAKRSIPRTKQEIMAERRAKRAQESAANPR